MKIATILTNIFHYIHFDPPVSASPIISQRKDRHILTFAALFCLFDMLNW